LSAEVARRLGREGRRFASILPRGDQRSEGFWVEGTTLYGADGQISFAFVDLDGIASLRGAHNGENAAAAFAVAVEILGGLREANWRLIGAAMRTFPGLPHRMEQVGRRGEALFVNDSKATNADSTEKALLSFNDIHWILGGKPKAGGIASLRRYFSRVEKAYLIGAASDEFAQTLDGEVPYLRAGTLEKAVELAAEGVLASKARQPVVLLSPACASYDQFPNYEVRGNRFRELVQALPGIRLTKGA
jgi:UDP-N-acetylmuramoylalanine--D-glutamate ligase